MAAQTIARPMPVLPEVASITVWPGFSAPDFSRRFDDAERQAIFHRAERIEGFDLDEEIDALRRELVDPDHRRAADGAENTVELGHGGCSGKGRELEPLR